MIDTMEFIMTEEEQKKQEAINNIDTTENE